MVRISPVKMTIKTQINIEIRDFFASQKVFMGDIRYSAPPPPHTHTAKSVCVCVCVGGGGTRTPCPPQITPMFITQFKLILLNRGFISHGYKIVLYD